MQICWNIFPNFGTEYTSTHLLYNILKNRARQPKLLALWPPEGTPLIEKKSPINGSNEKRVNSCGLQRQRMCRRAYVLVPYIQGSAG